MAHKDKWRCMETIFRWMIAFVFIIAGVPKIFDIKGFSVLIGAYGLVPDPLLLPAAVIISTAEVAGAIGLVLRQKWAPCLIAFLLLLFIAVLGYGIWLGLDIDCGCFGEADVEHKAFSGLKQALVRDLLLLLPLAYIYLRSSIKQKNPQGGEK